MPLNPTPVKPDLAKPHILIVDDSAGHRFFVRTILQVLNVELAEASEGGEALTLLAARDFDVVVTDLQMTPQTGFDLINGLAALPPARRKPRVIVCSALVGGHAISGRRELLDASALLQKPVRAGELLAEVARALEGAPG